MEKKSLQNFIKEYSKWRNGEKMQTVGGKNTPKTIQEFFEKRRKKVNKK